MGEERARRGARAAASRRDWESPRDKQSFLGQRLKSLLEASSLLAAAIYAFGWIFAARLFARFGVTPEEAGYSFAFLLIRVVFLVAAFVALVMLVVWALNRLARYSGARRVTLRRERVGVVAACVMGAVLLVIPPLWLSFRSSAEVAAEGANISWLALVAPAFGLFAYGASRIAGGRWYNDDAEDSEVSFSLESVARRASYGFAVLGIGALIAVPFVAADRYADQIEAGKELRAPILPGIAGLSIQRVQATTSDDKPISPLLGRTACVHLLGSSGGSIVLYDHESASVVRVPQGRVSLEDPCN